MQLSIIDGTPLLYITGWANKDSSNLDTYIKFIDQYLNTILETTAADYYILLLDTGSFRKQDSNYKGDRKKVEINFFKELKDHLFNAWGAYTDDLLENDDLCLILKNEYKKDFDIVICTIDSDILQTPGVFYNFRKHKFSNIQQQTALRNISYQLLTKGHNNKPTWLEKCGETKANKLLDKIDKNQPLAQYLAQVLEAYIKGIPESNIKGYGLFNGIQKFAESAKFSVLLRTSKECAIAGIPFDIADFKPIKLNK